MYVLAISSDVPDGQSAIILQVPRIVSSRLCMCIGLTLITVYCRTYYISAQICQIYIHIVKIGENIGD